MAVLSKFAAPQNRPTLALTTPKHAEKADPDESLLWGNCGNQLCRGLSHEHHMSFIWAGWGGSCGNQLVKGLHAEHHIG